MDPPTTIRFNGPGSRVQEPHWLPFIIVLGRVRNSCMLVLRLCCAMVASQHVVDTRQMLMHVIVVNVLGRKINGGICTQNGNAKLTWPWPMRLQTSCSYNGYQHTFPMILRVTAPISFLRRISLPSAALTFSFSKNPSAHSLKDGTRLLR